MLIKMEAMFRREKLVTKYEQELVSDIAVASLDEIPDAGMIQVTIETSLFCSVALRDRFSRSALSARIGERNSPEDV